MFDKRLVLEFLSRIEKKIQEEKILERDIKIDIIKNKAISIIGPRRSGKTYLLWFFFKKYASKSIYLDFENIAFRNITPEDVLEILSISETYHNKKISFVFLDEIQNLPNWERLVRSLLDMGYFIFISGSSSKLLSKEIATSLRGRTLTYTILPFSFREYLNIKSMKIKKELSISEETKLKKYLENYLEWGGYPEVVLYPKKRESLLKEYYDLIFYKDFVERFEIKSLNVAELLFEFLLQNFSKEISINKIVNFVTSRIKVHTKSTIYSYIDKISDIFFAFFLERYRKSVYERKSWPKKIYLCDLGLSNLVRFEIDLGKRTENIVFLEFLRKRNLNPLLKIYYWKDSQGKEVDFVVKEGLKVKQLIQVCYNLEEENTKKREIRSLLKASKELKCKDLLIITWDYEGEEKFENKKIKFIPLWKWLLR